MNKLESEFLFIKESLLKEVGYQSNPNIINNNKNYKKIISFGKKIIPILVKDMNENDMDWIFALSEILNVNPIKPENNGYWNKMKEDWNDYIKYEYN